MRKCAREYSTRTTITTITTTKRVKYIFRFSKYYCCSSTAFMFAEYLRFQYFQTLRITFRKSEIPKSRRNLEISMVLRVFHDFRLKYLHIRCSLTNRLKKTRVLILKRNDSSGPRNNSYNPR